MAVFTVIPGKYTNLDAVQNTLAYISRENRESKDAVYAIGGFGIDYENYKNSVKEFKVVKKIWEEEDKRQVVHAVVSFGKEEMDKLKLSDIEKLAYPIGKIVSKDEFQVRWAIHIDTDNVHIQYVINSVSFLTGKKYRLERGEGYEIRQKINKLIEPYTHKVCYTMEELEAD